MANTMASRSTTLCLAIAASVAPAHAQRPPTAAERARHPIVMHRVSPPCIAGFVWREAFSGDDACVEPRRRDLVREENAVAASRVQPGGGAYGPDTCRQGYVWREARPADHVCVTPPSRDLVHRENAIAPTRFVKSACVSQADCRRQADEAARQVAILRQRIAKRRADLQAAKAQEARAAAQLRAQDEAWMRANPGLGRTSQPSTVDNVTPIEGDIAQLEKLLQQEQQHQAAVAAAPAAK